mgnify:CR=1 FL=1
MNIIIFNENGSSKLEELINLDDEMEIRQFKLDELDNYKQYNPSLIILSKKNWSCWSKNFSKGWCWSNSFL